MDHLLLASRHTEDLIALTGSIALTDLIALVDSILLTGSIALTDLEAAALDLVAADITVHHLTLTSGLIMQ